MKAIRLRTADLKNPIGIDIKKPVFSWNCEGGRKQQAYQVKVKDALSDEILFDSGRVEGDDMRCTYQGTELHSRQIVSWSVKLWDETGKEINSADAFFEMGLFTPGDWKAKWISGIGTDQKKRLPADYYQKTVFVGKDLCRARLYVTSLGVYAAKVNGEIVSTVLSPGTTQYDKRLYYQTYDVTKQLRAGADNDLLFCVADGWYKGKLGADQCEYVFGTQTKLLAQLELTYSSGRRETIGTDDTFFWSNEGPVRFSDLKDGEIYDANKKLYDADGKSVFSQHAAECEKERRIPTASNAPVIRERENFAATLEVSPSGQKILNFGQNMAGYVRFRIKEPKGTKVTLSLFEAKDHGEYSDISLSFPSGNVDPVKQQIVYYASGEEDVFEPQFFYSGFQYALVEGISDVLPEDFTAVAVYSDLEYGSSFCCSNEKINQFLKNTVWSMKGNFVDVPTDCPQREKAGWTGDAQVFCKTAVYFADTKAFYRKWLRDVSDCQEESGLVEDVNPTIKAPGDQRPGIKGSIGWADAAVIIPWTLWKQTGDASFIYDNYELMHGWKNYMEHLCRDKSMFDLPPGHPMSDLAPLYQAFRLKDSPWNKFIPEAGIHWGEWCVPESQEPPAMDSVSELLKPKQELTCAYTHYSMGLLEEMLRFIGKSGEADEVKEYVDGSFQAYHVHWVKDETIRTNHMAELVRPIALGLLTDQEKKNAAAELNAMVEKRNYKVGTGFLSTPFLLQTLAENGYADSAYRMLENEQAPGWLAMVNQGATTVWEDYECYDENGTPLAHSFNHYSMGAVCTFLYDTVCGIRVTGKNRVAIAPIPGGSLSYAKAEVLTAYGKVSSAWEKVEDGTYRYRFEIPANVTAELTLPDGRKEVLEAGSYER